MKFFFSFIKFKISSFFIPKLLKMLYFLFSNFQKIGFVIELLKKFLIASLNFKKIFHTICVTNNFMPLVQLMCVMLSSF